MQGLNELPADGIKERLAIGQSRIEARAGARPRAARVCWRTLGATAPFVGLFCTV
jgi:hypothetical protein